MYVCAVFGQIARDDFKCGADVEKFCGDVPKYLSLMLIALKRIDIQEFCFFAVVCLTTARPLLRFCLARHRRDLGDDVSLSRTVRLSKNSEEFVATCRIVYYSGRGCISKK